MKFQSDKKDWKKFEQNNKEIALNILFVLHNKKEMYIKIYICISCMHIKIQPQA